MTAHHLIFPTRLGDAAVIYKDSPFSLTRTLLPCSSLKPLREKIRRHSAGGPGDHADAVAVSKTISQYIAGAIQKIVPPWQWMEMDGLTPLQTRVLAATARIPFGTTAAYQSIARAVGHPRACRFVGTTLAKNPFPIIIPCHRVIRSDGTLGRFGGGTALKKMLLELEGCQAERQAVDC